MDLINMNDKHIHLLKVLYYLQNQIYLLSYDLNIMIIILQDHLF